MLRVSKADLRAAISHDCLPVAASIQLDGGRRPKAKRASVSKILASGWPECASQTAAFLRARGCLRLLLSACNAAAAPPERSGRRLPGAGSQ